MTLPARDVVPQQTVEVDGRTRRVSDRRTVRWLVLVTALVVVSACSDDEVPPRPAVQERSWDVVGVVVSAEHRDGYETTGGMTARGHPGAGDFTVGPMDLLLSDGARLHVPAGTPGGNACLPLMTEADRRFVTGMSGDRIPDETVRQLGGLSDDCVVIAALHENDEHADAYEDDPDGVVEWFQILETDDHGRATVGDLVERRGSGLLTESGFVFDLASDAALTCGPEQLELEAFLEPDRWEEVAVDVTSGDIAEIECVGRA